ALDRLLVGKAGGAADHLARRVVSDILVGPAGSWRAGRVQLGEAGAKEARVLPLLELVVIGVAIESEAVRQQVTDGRAIFVAGRQLKIGRVVHDRGFQVDLALLGELGDHRRCYALRHRSPAEYGIRSDRLVRSFQRVTVALEE